MLINDDNKARSQIRLRNVVEEWWWTGLTYSEDLELEEIWMVVWMRKEKVRYEGDGRGKVSANEGEGTDDMKGDKNGNEDKMNVKQK